MTTTANVGPAANTAMGPGSGIGPPPLHAFPTWQEIPLGGILAAAGNAAAYDTGSWRTRRPVHDGARCTHCMICWLYCPDSAIEVADRRVVGIDYDHCKGCGICAYECPVKGAITMVAGGGV